MKTILEIELTDQMLFESLSRLNDDDFCKFLVGAELDRASYGSLVGLIRHFKFVEEQFSDHERLECGDLSPKEIKINE